LEHSCGATRVTRLGRRRGCRGDPGHRLRPGRPRAAPASLALTLPVGLLPFLGPVPGFPLPVGLRRVTEEDASVAFVLQCSLPSPFFSEDHG
jgi:hypothetical protein